MKNLSKGFVEGYYEPEIIKKDSIWKRFIKWIKCKL